MALGLLLLAACGGRELNVETAGADEPASDTGEDTGAASECGNGIIEAGETCDDGPNPSAECAYGLTSCNVCDSNCEWVAGLPRVCGDGVIQDLWEQCDDGNTVTEACSYGEMSCTVCDAACNEVAGATSYCGDGVYDP